MLRPLADVGDPRFLQLLIWWRAARGDRAWPARPYREDFHEAALGTAAQ
jgi:hypothetical protein